MDKNKMFEYARDLRNDLKYAFEQGEGQTPNHKDVKVMDWLIEKVKMNENQLEAMKDSIKIQGNDGNWNYDSYMHGMYNGMELMLAIADNREPVFREKPEKWVKDEEVNTEKTSESKVSYG